MSRLSPIHQLRRRKASKLISSSIEQPLPEAASLMLRPQAFLNQLFHFDTPQLVVRGHRTTLCQQSEFGIFFNEQNEPASDAPGSIWLNDPVSGLRINASAITGIFFLNETGKQPAFELQMLHDGFACAIQPSRTERNLQLIRKVLSSFNAKEVSALELRNAGAGAWLDDWGNEGCAGSSSIEFNPSSSRAVISLQGVDLKMKTVFESTGFDEYRESLRLSEIGTQSVLFTDRSIGNGACPAFKSAFSSSNLSQNIKPEIHC